MVDWLIVWGAVEATGILVKPILEDLAKDSVKDYAKDFFKDCLKKIIHLPEKDVQKEAYGKALKEFLELVQQELETAGYQEAQIKQYIQPLKQFIENEKVAAILGQAFEPECRTLNTNVLTQTWQELNLPYLPYGFDWDLVCKLYIRRAKAIIQKSEQLRPIFAAESQAAAAKSLQELVGIAPEFDLGRYAEGLREQYGNLKLESLDTSGVYYNELKLWKIFVPQNVRECQEFLPQVYEIPKDHLRRLRERGELDEAEVAEAEVERYRRVYVEQPIRSVLEVVGDPTSSVGENSRSPLQNAVILGDPGSGKSTLLQYLALVWAERPLSELPLHPIPLLIELRTYARDKQEKKYNEILSFIHSGNIACRLNQQQLHEKLKAGHAIALFDGVDEVFDPQLRDEVVTDIHRFTNDYPQVQAVVTSRWLGYKAHQLRSAEFRHFMLQDLEDEQIEDFIQCWHNLTFPEGADKTRKRERLQKAIDDSKAIRELAGNPLLLTMMAILNRNQELPRDRPELYKQASRVLLHQWDVERNLIEHRLDPMTFDYRDKQAMLRKVAYHMQSSEKGLAGNIISASDLESILVDYLKTIEVEQPRTVARLMINQLRTRNFILCFLGADSYAFVHRTFLEYFCAWEFVDQFEKQHILTEEQLKTEVFDQHWQDVTWHEVLRLIIGLLGEQIAIKIVDHLTDNNDEIVINLSDSKLEELMYSNEFSSALLPFKCFLEIRNNSGVKSTVSKLINSLKSLANRDHLESAIAKEVMSLIATIWKGNSKSLQWLKRYAYTSKNFNARQAAVYEIANIWKDSPQTLNWLKTYAQNNEASPTQSVAIWELSKKRKDDPEVLSIVKDCARHRLDSSARATSVRVLAKYWRDDSETLPIIRERMEHDDSPHVRWTVVEMLAQVWKDDSATLSTLKSIAQFDNYWAVRRDALEEIAGGWKDEIGTFEFLYDCAISDSFDRAQEGSSTNPRLVAINEILRNYSDHPKTLNLLQDRAANDPDEQVREFAKQQLAKLE